MSALCPQVSVILPVRNEAPFIEQALRAVLEQDYPRDLTEVIVADGMSEDGTREIVRELAAQEPRLRLLDNPRHITPAGLNLAIRAARGDVIVRVDGHGVLPPHYLRECVACLEPEDRGQRAEDRGRESVVSGQWSVVSTQAAVGGALDCVGRGAVGEAIALTVSSRFGVGGSRYRTCRREDQPVLTDSVPFWAMRREVFERIGLFREEMLCHEDYEFSHRLRQAGGRILLLPWLRSIYYVRPNLRALCRQYGRYGFWKGRFLRSHPGSLQPRHFAPPLFVLVLAMAAGWSLFSPVGLRCAGALAGLYGVFLLVATVLLAASRSPSRDGPHPADVEQAAQPADSRSVPAASLWRAGSTVQQPDASKPLLVLLFLPFVLAALHLCWGTGVWLGLLRGPVLGEPPKLAA